MVPKAPASRGARGARGEVLGDLRHEPQHDLGVEVGVTHGSFQRLARYSFRIGLEALREVQASRGLIIAFVALSFLAGAAIPAARSGEAAVSAPEAILSPSESVDSQRMDAALRPLGVSPSASRVVVPEPALIVSEGSVGASGTLASALGAQGVSPRTLSLIVDEMAPHFDFRRARPEHRFQLSTTADGEVVEFRYVISDTTSYRMLRWGNGFEVSREEAAFDARRARMSGVVESSLYTAIMEQGEGSQLARDFAEVFAWDIDFQRSVHAGDQFELLYERLYRTNADGSEDFVRTGRILAARYEGTVGAHTALYFEPKEGRGGYYRPDGSSVERQFLMAPLRHARISSSFNPARRHPILKVVRPHFGIDYAAPHGSPVWAVADGVVIHRSRSGGFGNLVKIRHTNGYVSYYAHLSRYAKGMRVGERVEQKQVIGYVGSTGLSTGPHVCFRIARNGRYVNPARLRTPAGDPIDPDLIPVFQETTAALMAELDGGPRLASESAL